MQINVIGQRINWLWYTLLHPSGNCCLSRTPHSSQTPLHSTQSFLCFVLWRPLHVYSSLSWLKVDRSTASRTGWLNVWSRMRKGTAVSSNHQTMMTKIGQLRQKIVRTRRINEPLSVSLSHHPPPPPSSQKQRAVLSWRQVSNRPYFSSAFLMGIAASGTCLLHLGLGLPHHLLLLLLRTMMYEPVTHPTTDGYFDGGTQRLFSDELLPITLLLLPPL